MMGCLTVASAMGAALAGPRTSAQYGVATEVEDGGGQRAASALYSNDGSIAPVAGGISAAPGQVGKSGYLGQVYEVTGLAVSGAHPAVDEAATLQLAAWEIVDDATFLAVPAQAVDWEVVSGPVAGIDADGVATAQSVYQTTPATVQGTFAGRSGDLTFTVNNVAFDDFGPYAADGLPDEWQVQYFGPANASGKGGPDDDFDGTGQTNLFKYTAGLNPIDPKSRFDLSIELAPGSPRSVGIRFSPVVSGRVYKVESTSSLTTPEWRSLTSATEADNGTTRTVTDTDAAELVKYYRVQILKP
jgi:hypothetical protein